MKRYNVIFFRYDTSDCENVLSTTAAVYKDGYIGGPEKSSYFSGLRPVCADDIPIIGK